MGGDWIAQLSVPPVPSALTALLVPMLLDCAVKATVLLLLATAAAALLSRASAAMRHAVWFLAILALALLPVLTGVLPTWRVVPAWMDPRSSYSAVEAVPPAPAQLTHELPPYSNAGRNGPRGAHAISEPSRGITGGTTGGTTGSGNDRPADLVPSAPIAAAAAPNPAADRAPWRWATWVGSAWAAGVALTLLPLLLAWLSLRRLSRRSRPITTGPWVAQVVQVARQLGLRAPVRLVQGPNQAMPMAWGALHPTVLLPADAAGWSPNRGRIVLLHELAHIKRRDYLTHLLARVIVALYWFHPLAWLALSRLRVERERACDDLVLAAGSAAPDYAEQLLQIATGLTAPALAAAAAQPMARRSTLEGRLLAILDKARDRRPITRTAVLIAVAVLAGVAVPIAMLRAAEPSTDTPHPAPAIAPATTAAPATPKPPSAATKPYTFRGTCVDDHNQPVAGATILVQLEAAPDRGAVPTKTDAHGTFEVPNVARDQKGRFIVVGMKPGLAVDWASWMPGWRPFMFGGFAGGTATDDPPMMRFILGTPTTIAGHVVTDDGKPIAGLHVWVKYMQANGRDGNGLPHLSLNSIDRSEVGLWAQTGADGRFEIGGLPEDADVTLVARHPDYEEREVRTTSGQMHVALALAPAAVIEGHVIDAVAGGPAVGVVVQARPSRNESAFGDGNRASATTDATGFFRLGCLPQYKFDIWAAAPDRTAAVIKDLATQPGQTTHAPDLRLTEGVIVNGRVVDAQTNQPIRVDVPGGISVWPGKLNDAWDVGYLARVNVNLDGSFQIHLPPGSSMLTLHCDESKAWESAEKGPMHLEIEEGDHVNKTFLVRRRAVVVPPPQAQPGAILVGRVVDEQGGPVARAVVNVAMEGDTGAKRHMMMVMPSMAVRSDAQGRFEFTGAPRPASGNYHLFASARGFGQKQLTEPESKAKDGRLDVGDITLPRATLSVSGRVVDAQGRPVVNASVHAGGSAAKDQEVVTDEDGRFVVPDLVAGTMILQATAPVHGQAVLQGVRAGQTDVQITLQAPAGRNRPPAANPQPTTRPAPAASTTLPATSFRATVVDSAGKPIGGAEVSAGALRNGTASVFRDLTSDAGGHVQWDNVPGDAVILQWVRAAGFRAVGSPTLKLGKDDQTVVLPRTLTIRGAVTDASTGKPIPVFQVVPGQAWQEGQLSWSRRDSAKQEGGKLEWSPKGAYPVNAVRIEAKGYVPLNSPVWLNREGEIRFDAALQPAKPLIARLVDADGDAVKGAEVFVGTASRNLSFQDGKSGLGDTLSMLTVADGRFWLQPQEEPYAIVVIASGGFAQATEEQLRANSTVMLQPWAQVEGQTRRGREPFPSQKVTVGGNWLVGPANVYFSSSTTSDATGHFAFRQVPPVPGSLQVARTIVYSRAMTEVDMSGHTVHLNPTSGKTEQVTIGGEGRTIKGRLVGTDAQALDLRAKFSYGCLTSTIATMPPAQGNAREARDGGRAVLAQERAHRVVTYGVAIDDDGAFSIDDVPPGHYLLSLFVNELNHGPSWGFGKPVGGYIEFLDVPTPESVPDQPLELGAIRMKPPAVAAVSPAAPATQPK